MIDSWAPSVRHASTHTPDARAPGCSYYTSQATAHRRRSGWTSGGGTHGERRRWLRVPSGVRYGEGCPLSSRLRGLGERRELPQRGPGQTPDRKRILAYFEGHRTLIFVPIWQNLGEAICISVPRSKFGGGGTCPPVPRDLGPCYNYMLC